MQTFTGVRDFTAPDHDYPAYLELVLTARDGTLRDHVATPGPRTVDLTFEIPPAGLALRSAAEAQNAPFTRTGDPGLDRRGRPRRRRRRRRQDLRVRQSWSDGGARRPHVVGARDAPATYRATYAEAACRRPPASSAPGASMRRPARTVTDASGRGNTGTISGATRDQSGRPGAALTFDGVNDLVTVADSASLDLTTRATLEAWVNPTASSDWRTILLKEQPGHLDYALYANNDANRPSGHVYAGADRDTNGSSALPPTPGPMSR